MPSDRSEEQPQAEAPRQEADHPLGRRGDPVREEVVCGTVPRVAEHRQGGGRTDPVEEEVRQRYVDQVPMKRGCTYDDITNALVFLASDQASYMTGQAINVTGGQQMD